MELPLLQQAPPAGAQSELFPDPPPFPRKRRFPIKTASNYLGLAADQKGLLPGLFSKPSGKAGC